MNRHGFSPTMRDASAPMVRDAALPSSAAERPRLAPERAQRCLLSS